jgi:hypothetical protein
LDPQNPGFSRAGTRRLAAGWRLVLVATITALCALAGTLASVARADDATTPAAPITASDPGSPSPDTSNSGSDPGTSASDQIPASSDPVPGQEQPVTDQPSSSPPADSSAGAESSPDAGGSADSSAGAGGSEDSGSRSGDPGARPADSDPKHGFGAANTAADVGGGAGGALPASLPASSAAGQGPAPAVGAPIPLPPTGADSWAILFSADTGGMSLLSIDSAHCGFCYRGARFAAWLANTASGSQLQHRSTTTGGPSTAALSRIAFARAPESLTAQLFRLLGGGGGSAALLLFAFLAVAAAIALFPPDWTRAFRISAATWRPSLYVRPLELPG